jgi:hypothetical protein
MLTSFIEYSVIRNRIKVAIFLITIAVIWAYPIAMAILLIVAAAISPRIRHFVKFHLTGD